jgi:hypothetical protein
MYSSESNGSIAHVSYADSKSFSLTYSWTIIEYRHNCIHSSDYRTIHTFLDLLRFDSLFLFDLKWDTVQVLRENEVVYVQTRAH